MTRWLKVIVMLTALAGPIVTVRPAAAAPTGGCTLTGVVVFDKPMGITQWSSGYNLNSTTFSCESTDGGPGSFQSQGTASGDILTFGSFQGTYSASNGMCATGTVAGDFVGGAVTATIRGVCSDGSTSTCSYQGTWFPQQFPVTSADVDGVMLCVGLSPK